MTNTTVAKDPVCGMDVDAAAAAGRTDYNGQTFYFCGKACKQKFDQHPEEFLRRSSTADTHKDKTS